MWGDVKNITVKRDSDGCLYLVVCCIVPEEHREREESGSIGMDFGMKTFLTLSDGNSVGIPDYHKEALKETKKADRSFSHKYNAKVYGSSYKRAKKARQKAHRKVADKRSDFHWKLAHELCRKYNLIAIEGLNLKGMQMHRNWGRKVSSLGFGEFVQKLMVVAEKYSTVVEKISRWEASSQTCSECGYVFKGMKDLSVMEWVCPQCGCVHDRDINAARNILRVAIEKYTGEDVPQAGSGSKTEAGTTGGGSRVADVSAVPAKNPTSSLVGVRQRRGKREKILSLEKVDVLEADDNPKGSMYAQVKPFTDEEYRKRLNKLTKQELIEMYIAQSRAMTSLSNKLVPVTDDDLGTTTSATTIMVNS